MKLRATCLESFSSQPPSFQRPVHPEIQDRDCGVRKLDCHLLTPKRQVTPAHHAAPTRGSLGTGWLMGRREGGSACQGQQGAEDSSAQGYLPRLDAVETHGHFRSRRLHQSLHFSFDGACQDQDRLAGSPAPHCPSPSTGPGCTKGKRLVNRSPATYV